MDFNFSLQASYEKQEISVKMRYEGLHSKERTSKLCVVPGLIWVLETSNKYFMNMAKLK